MLRLPFLRRRTHSRNHVGFFIVGTGRCGSTLLRNLLNLHPSVFVPSETHWIPIQYEMCGEQRLPIEIHTSILERVFFVGRELTVDVMTEEVGISREELFATVREKLKGRRCSVAEFNDALFMGLAAHTGRTIFGDKTPDYCGYIPTLRTIWPATKFVHIIRDGRDVALSMAHHPGYIKLVSIGETNWVSVALDKGFERAPIHTPELKDYIALWELRLRKIQTDTKSLTRQSYLEFRFEDLICAPREVLSNLAGFLNIQQDQNWLSCCSKVVNQDNKNKVKDRAVWEGLTHEARETLAALGYAIEWERL